MADKRFLVVRLGSLGDIVHTFPAVAGLRESFPGAEIIWLTHPRWVELVASSRLATHIWPVNSRDLSSVRSTIRKLRSACWDAAIDYQGLWKSAMLPFVGGIKKRIGFSSATIREYGVPVLYTDRVQTRSTHIVDQNGELTLRVDASKPLGQVVLHVSEAGEQEVQANLTAARIERYVVLSPGGGWLAKCWPPDRFGGLCQRITNELGLSCVINYGPGEEGLVASVQTSTGESSALAYNTGLAQLMALLRRAACVVAGDTGPLHLAAAFGTPTVALFGPTDPARNGPYSSHDIVLRSPHATTTYKRGDSPDASMLQLSVEEVFSALQRRIGANS